MARFNQTTQRRQRYTLRVEAERQLAAGAKPEIGADGKPYLTIKGRHYVLPADLLVRPLA